MGQGGEVMQGVIKVADCEALAGLSAEDVLREWNDADAASCSVGGRPSPALPPPVRLSLPQSVGTAICPYICMSICPYMYMSVRP